MSKQNAAADGANTAKGQPTPAAETQTQQGSTDDILAALLAEEGDANPEGIESESAASAEGAGNETDDLSQSESEEGSQQDEATEDDASEGEAATDEEAAESKEKADEEGETKGLSPRVQKRIDKLTAKNARLAEELSELRKQVETLGKGTAKPADATTSAEVPEYLREDAKVISTLQEQGKAQRELEAAQRLKRQLRDDPDKVIELLNKSGQQVATAEDAADVLDEYVQTQRERLSESRVAIGARRQEVEAQREATRKSMDALAQSRAPWLADEEDPRAVQVTQLLKNYPRLAQDPAARFIAVAVVKELGAIKAAEAIKARATGKPAPKPGSNGARAVSTGGTGRAAAVPGRPANARASTMQRLVENPTEDSLAAALEAELGGG
jgi:hypothetical protein